MPKSIALRQTANLNLQTPDTAPGIEVTPRPLWSPPQGLDYLNRQNRVDAQHATQMLNLWLDRGVMRSRYGSAQVGAAAADPVMGVVNFVTGSGIGFLLRFTTTKLEQWDGTTWNQVGTAAFTGGTGDYFAYTAFNDTLIFSNGVDGMWEYAPMLGALTLIAGAPNAQHLTTFGGRVVAASADGYRYRTQWSVKNNSRDWSGTGSGFEDLLSTPGGQVDQVIGVYPISDTTAIMLRTGSVWSISQTGDPNAPFRFERLYDNLGCRSRNSVDTIPGGVVFLGTDNIYVISDSQIQPIGQLVKDRILSEITDLAGVRGVYRPKTADYWLANGDVVYRYAFADKGWSRSKYPFNIRWMEESVFHYGGITWDEGVGTWDAQTTTWDANLGTAREAAMYFATDEAAGNVIQEDTSASSDGYVQAGHSAQGIEIDSGVLLAGSPLEKTEIIELQMEYESEEAQDLTLEYSTDLGATWTAYSTKSIVATSRQEILRAMKTLSRQSMMLRLTSTTLGQLVLISFIPFLVLEARVNH